jgi:hypothetical protein
VWIAVDKVDELLVAVIGPWGYCRGAVTSLLWPTISELVRAAHGPICCVCIASILALPSRLVTMATLGLSRRGSFEVGDGACVRCRLHGRVIRSFHGPVGAAVAAPFEVQAGDDPRDNCYS